MSPELGGAYKKKRFRGQQIKKVVVIGTSTLGTQILIHPWTGRKGMVAEKRGRGKDREKGFLDLPILNMPTLSWRKGNF
jgi:hypothetical protein